MTSKLPKDSYITFKFSVLVKVPTILLLPDYKLKRGEIITLFIKLPICYPPYSKIIKMF